MLRHIRHVGYAQLDEERDEEREREARASHQRNATQRVLNFYHFSFIYKYVLVQMYPTYPTDT